MHTLLKTIGIPIVLCMIAAIAVPQFSFAQSANQDTAQIKEFTNQRQLLLQAIDSFIKHAELLQERAGLFPVFQEEIRTSMLQETEADIIRLRAFKVSIQQASSNKELKMLAQSIRQYRTELVQTKTRTFMLIAHAEVLEHNILGLAAARAQSISERLHEFEQLGKDIQQLELLLIQAEETIQESKQELQQFKQEVLEHSIDTDFMTKSRKTLTGIKQKILETYGLFRTIAAKSADL